MVFPTRAGIETEGERKYISKERTSSNAWLPLTESAIIKNIFQRVAHVMKIPEQDFRHERAVEALQVIYYNRTEEYQVFGFCFFCF